MVWLELDSGLQNVSYIKHRFILILCVNRNSNEMNLSRLFWDRVYGWVMDMVFNATFNNISVISWWSVLLVEEARISGDNHQPTTSH